MNLKATEGDSFNKIKQTVWKVLFVSHKGNIWTSWFFFCGSFATPVKTWLEIRSSISANHGCCELLCRRFEFFYWCVFMIFHRYWNFMQNWNVYILNCKHKWHFQCQAFFHWMLCSRLARYYLEFYYRRLFLSYCLLVLFLFFEKFIFSWMIYSQLTI